MTYYKILITNVILLFSATFVSADVVINEENFPDEHFRGWVLSQEYGKDGVLTDEEIAGITNIMLCNKGIQSLKGIEHFTALVELDCGVNLLTLLDVSKNTMLEILRCGVNSLTSLDVSKNTMLKEISCPQNLISSLDVSKNVSLKSLGCGGNTLTSIDLSKNTMLKVLSCRNNLITSLDLSQNCELEGLWCCENQLTSLDLSNCPMLRDLFCIQNNLRTLNVSGCEKLEQINCFKNQIKGENMDAFIESLRSFKGPGHLPIVSLENEQNVMTTSQAKAARAKGWIPRYEYGSFGTHGWTEYKGKDDATGIDATTNLPSKAAETFDLQGRRIGKPQQGVNIIRNADGTTKKVLIKH
ncbi:MAG: hypothetical protein UHJ41_01510 [Bacteroidaceae bacterium]|nr:hypothetical protein [Bacteroidaceae bacterium]